MKKNKLIKLVSNKNTGYFIVKKKNKNKKKKLYIRKYDPIIRKHTLFYEKKI